jgi:hypothetical protein
MLIAGELVRQGNWDLAEKTGTEIHRTNRRHDCWRAMAGIMIQSSDLENGIAAAGKLKNSEAVSFYLKGWARNLSPASAGSAVVIKALPKFSGDPESILALLQAHALHEIFFGSAANKKIDRLNQTLNIQWAIDIKNSVSAA